jgi:hypothetical protein
MISSNSYVLNNPEVRSDNNIPETIPPVVSIEKDLPGLKPVAERPRFNSLTKANPEIRQKGVKIIRVKNIASRMDGTSPGLRNNFDKRPIRKREIKGHTPKIRLIFLISPREDLFAREAPQDDATSHDPRKTPLISS